eukprot:2906230-Rhodomonas_salina.1
MNANIHTETAFSVQFVPGMRFLVLDFGLYIRVGASAPTPKPSTTRASPWFHGGQWRSERGCSLLNPDDREQYWTLHRECVKKIQNILDPQVLGTHIQNL